MHAYRLFVQNEMDKRGWTAADLSRASGLSRQNLSRILNDHRPVLQRRPEPATVQGLARGFGLDEEIVLRSIAEAMGFRLDPVPAQDASALSNEELLRILAERLGERGSNGQQDAARMDREPQPDGITPGERPPTPWEQDDFDLAAKKGVNRGRQARLQQDRDAEEGGA